MSLFSIPWITYPSLSSLSITDPGLFLIFFLLPLPCLHSLFLASPLSFLSPLSLPCLFSLFIATRLFLFSTHRNLSLPLLSSFVSAHPRCTIVSTITIFFLSPSSHPCMLSFLLSAFFFLVPQTHPCLHFLTLIFTFFFCLHSLFLIFTLLPCLRSLFLVSALSFPVSNLSFLVSALFSCPPSSLSLLILPCLRSLFLACAHPTLSLLSFLVSVYDPFLCSL
jgi:hypothetical protein